MEFDIISKHNCWGENRIFFFNPEGKMISVPSHWTSEVLPDPFVTQSAGRCILHYQDLGAMAKLLKEIDKEISKTEGEKSVKQITPHV